MLNTDKLTTQENIHLVDEIAVVAPKATPLMTLLMSKGQYKSGEAKYHTWREKTLDFGDVSVAEGAEATNFVNGVRKELNNIMEIFMKSTSVSGTAQATGATGDLFASEINDRLAEVKVAIEKRLLNGVKDDATATGIRKMAGLVSFADADNTFESAGVKAVSEADIKGLARKLWDAGNENADIYVIVSADTKEQIDELYVSNYNYTHKTDNFGILVSSINTNYGTVNILVDRHMDNDKAVAFDLNAVSIAFLRQPHFEQLAKTGDNIKGQVVAEATLEVSSKKSVALLNIKQA